MLFKTASHIRLIWISCIRNQMTDVVGYSSWESVIGISKRLRPITWHGQVLICLLKWTILTKYARLVKVVGWCDLHQNVWNWWAQRLHTLVILDCLCLTAVGAASVERYIAIIKCCQYSKRSEVLWPALPQPSVWTPAIPCRSFLLSVHVQATCPDRTTLYRQLQSDYGKHRQPPKWFMTRWVNRLVQEFWIRLMAAW